MKRKAMITSVLMAFLLIVLTLPKAVYGADAPALGPLKAGEYMEHIEGYEFPLCSTKDYEIEYDRFILKVEAGVYIDESFPAIIDEIMGIIEEKTNLSFMPKSSPVNYEGKSTLKTVCDIKYKDSLTVDYTEAFAYCQQVLGREIKGIGGIFYGTGKLSFYDAHDRLIYEIGDKNTSFYDTIYVPHAVKYVITGSGTNDFTHSESMEKDAFSDASYTNIKSGIGAVKDNSTVSGKPASIKVKSEKALATALKKCTSDGSRYSDQ